ncbi:MAG: hypothetical protein Q8S15_00295 [Erysipelotrichaceae bacterium]|nr:hypothetical protein [Erysipelotrichaceae bacterium]
MNPHYANNNEPDFLSISEPKLLEFLEGEVAIGYLRKTSFQSEGKAGYILKHQITCPSILLILLTSVLKPNYLIKIKKIQEPLFAPLLLTFAPVLSIESEYEIVDMIMTLQDLYIKALRTNQKELRLFDYMDYNLLNHCVKSIIDFMKYISL